MKGEIQNLRKRPITSLVVFISFIFLVPSGFLVFVADKGSADFKHIAGASHWMASIIFLISAIIHVLLNWKAMKRYMIEDTSTVPFFKKEFVWVILGVTMMMCVAGSYEFFI